MLRVLHSRWFGFAMGILCALALVVALGSVTGVWAGGLAQGGQPPAGPTSPDVAMGDAIPIQGRLTDASGSPLNGTYDMTFKIYSVAVGGTAVCTSTQTAANAVTVSNGLFSSSITGCANDDINGWSQLYVGIAVGTDLEMAPRQPIGSVPFARSLRPGANIRGTGGSYILQVTQANITGTALYGLASSITGNTSGVMGIALSQDGYGGYFMGGGPSGSGAALYANGDVKQALAADGLVKAAVYAQCSASGSAITRSFNNVTGTITISNGASAGECTIDFGFDVSDRYVSVTAPGTVARIVTSAGGTTVNRLNIFRWDTTGVGTSGPIAVLIY